MIKILKNFKAVEWFLVIAIIGMTLLQVWLDLEVPVYLGKITELIQTPGTTAGDILPVGGMMLLFTINSVIVSFIIAAVMSWIATRSSARLRLKLFDHVQAFSLQEMHDFSTASLITRTTKDVNQYEMFIVIGLQSFIKVPILSTWVISRIINHGLEWSIATALAFGALFVMVIAFALIVLPKYRKAQERTDALNRISRENIGGVRVVRAFNADDYQSEKFETDNKKLMEVTLFTSRAMAMMMPFINIVMNGLILSIYWIGAVLISQADPQLRIEIFSNMMVYVLYIFQLIGVFFTLIYVFFYLPMAMVSAKRIDEVLKKKPTIKDGLISDNNQKEKGTITFENVYFRYVNAEDDVLKNMSFHIKQGQTVAFIGSTGSGKSTVANLIPRFYDVTNGHILIDGQDIRTYTQETLRNKIGLVTQKAVLFSGTITSNVLFGSKKDDIDEVYMKSAIEIAQAKNFIEDLENQYEGNVDAGGANLSGGQRQRLAIARALAKKPEIIIFDDSFSALDYQTDHILRKALKKELKDTTIIIVAQRIGTIKDADHIIVLDKGQIVGAGTHDVLMQTSLVYQEIAYSQLSKEELL